MKSLLNFLKTKDKSYLRKYCNKYRLVDYGSHYTKEDYVDLLMQFFNNYENYRYLLDDSEVAYFTSNLDVKQKNKVFRKNIRNLINKRILYREKGRYYFYEETKKAIDEYFNHYSLEEVERFGMYKYITIAYTNAYGTIREHLLLELLEEVFENFESNEYMHILEDSYGYYGKVTMQRDNNELYIGNDDREILEFMIEQNLCADNTEELKQYSEKELNNFYFYGYDYQNEELKMLLEEIEINPKNLSNEWLKVIRFTYGLVIGPRLIQMKIISRLRYDDLYTAQDIVDVLAMVDKVLLTYHPYISGGHSLEEIKQQFQSFQDMLEIDDDFDEEDDELPVIN